jgi:hypothetical protein
MHKKRGTLARGAWLAEQLGMSLRDLATRLVLATAALTAVATSAPPGDIRESTANTTVAAGDSGHATLRVPGVTTQQADRIYLYLTATARSGAPAVTVVPDDPAIPPFALADYTTLSLDSCDPGRPCELGLRFEVAGTGSVDLDVTVEAQRDGDPSLCSPDDRTFSDDAVVEATWDA